MVRIIDMECNVPRQATSEAVPASTGDTSVDSGAQTADRESERPAGYGMANYGRIFRSRREGSDSSMMEMDAYVDMLGKLGVERAIPIGISNENIADIINRHGVCRSTYTEWRPIGYYD